MMLKTGFKGSMISILALAAIATCPGASALIGPEGSAATPAAAAAPRFPNQAEITAAYQRSTEGDSPAAIKTLLPFAEKGNAFAQNALGLVYLSAPDLKPDYAKALMWFRKSAALGFGGAYSNLIYGVERPWSAKKHERRRQMV
jgi:TPR repeat protein